MKLIIDRKIWLRGEGSDASYLRRVRDGKQCCVGILCSALGASDVMLNNATEIQRLIHRLELLHVPVSVEEATSAIGVIPEWMKESRYRQYVSGEQLPEYPEISDIYSAYNINDDKSLSEEEREQKISAIFARHDIQVEFIG